MEGKEVRFGIANSALWATATTAASNGSVNAMHDSFTPLGGHGPDVADAARRGRLRRRRLRPLRHAHVRDRRGVHRRPDGRPHAGVPRQEDRGVRDEDGVARHPDPAAPRAVRHRARRDASTRARPASPIRPRTASPRSSTRSRRPATTTAARSPACPPTRRSTTRRSASCMLFARYWLAIPVLALAGSLAAAKHVPPSGGHAADAHAAVRRRADRHRSIIVGALTFVPALALGPIVEHLLLFARHDAAPAPRHRPWHTLAATPRRALLVPRRGR